MSEEYFFKVRKAISELPEKQLILRYIPESFNILQFTTLVTSGFFKGVLIQFDHVSQNYKVTFKAAVKEIQEKWSHESESPVFCFV